MNRTSLLLGAALAAIVAAGLFVLRAGPAQHRPRDASPAAMTTASVGAGIRVAADPVAIAIGAGSVWVIDAGHGTLSVIDPRTHRVRRRSAPIGGGPFAVAVGAGLVWVAGGDGSIRAFDPRSAEPAGRAAHVGGANGLAVGAGGVWVTSRLARTVTRVDPRTRRTGPPIRVGAGPADVAVGAGSVWVANADDGTVTRIDPQTRRVDAAIATGGSQVRALAVGEGGVWVARAGGLDAGHTQIVRIDPRAREITGAPIDVAGSIPLDVAAGAGSVWVTDIGELRSTAAPTSGHVTRLDPRRHAIVGPLLHVGGRPTAIAVDAGGAWVAGGGGGTVTPITVRPPP